MHQQDVRFSRIQCGWQQRQRARNQPDQAPGSRISGFGWGSVGQRIGLTICPGAVAADFPAERRCRSAQCARYCA